MTWALGKIISAKRAKWEGLLTPASGNAAPVRLFSPRLEGVVKVPESSLGKASPALTIFAHHIIHWCHKAPSLVGTGQSQSEAHVTACGHFVPGKHASLTTIGDDLVREAMRPHLVSRPALVPLLLDTAASNP